MLLKKAALSYAELGWKVLPLHSIRQGKCTCGKLDCRSAGKHPRIKKGVLWASSSEYAIDQWWSKWPDANIGIATGGDSGLVVIDVDPRNGGDKSYAELLEKHGELPPTVMVDTGGGGFHVYTTCEQPVKSGNNKLGAGLDIKSDGGYVVAPPSNHVLGEYRWRVGWSPYEVELTNMPAGIVSTLLSRINDTNKKGTIKAHVLEGDRNVYLTSAAGRIRARGGSGKNIESELLRINMEICRPPLSRNEVEHIARSVSKYEKGKTEPVHVWRDYIRSELGPSGRSKASMRHMLINLSFYMNGFGDNCYPTIAQIQKETGYTIAHISKVLSEAEKMGWIDKISHKGKGQAWRNTIYWPRLPDSVLCSEQHLLETYCPEAIEVLSRKQIKHH